MTSKISVSVPVIDLFAGPGGLGEGFSRLSSHGSKCFKIALSIEKEPFAHKTLTLRAFYRQFLEGKAPKAYYQYLRGEISREELFERYPEQAEVAINEAQLLTLGKDDPNELIAQKLAGKKHWVLIGGPPCQAYSLVGRSKILGSIKKAHGESSEEFEKRRVQEFDNDHRHELYKQYLAIIAKHSPSIFVMENVRGILSSKLNGDLIFPRILQDLINPSAVFPGEKRKYRYRIYSLTTPSNGEPSAMEPTSFLIHSEKYGVPQARHRVILLGVRDDFALNGIPLLECDQQKFVRDVIDDLPKLTPGVTKLGSTRAYDALAELKNVHLLQCASGERLNPNVFTRLQLMIDKAFKRENRGARFLPTNELMKNWWYHDPQLGGVCNHETRSHIQKDLWRYAFAACYADIYGTSPQLRNFPKALLPEHANVDEAIEGQKFGDRFRVQVAGRPSSTITSHISKDGHYFIHYDPRQYRSLTVREAARLQSFPDNYFFEGPRTSQYQQVGNAVPPLLAYRIAKIVSKIIDMIRKANHDKD